MPPKKVNRKKPANAAEAKTEPVAAPRRQGRPTAYTKEAGDKVIAAAEFGLAMRICADDAGVPRKLAQSWLESGEADDTVGGPNPDLVDFARRFRQAHAMFVKRSHMAIMRSDDHKAKIRLMETVYRETYAPLQKVEVTGKDGGAIETRAEVDYSKMTTGELRKLLAEQEEALGQESTQSEATLPPGEPKT